MNHECSVFEVTQLTASRFFSKITYSLKSQLSLSSPQAPRLFSVYLRTEDIWSQRIALKFMGKTGVAVSSVTLKSSSSLLRCSWEVWLKSNPWSLEGEWKACCRPVPSGGLGKGWSGLSESFLRRYVLAANRFYSHWPYTMLGVYMLIFVFVFVVSAL